MLEVDNRSCIVWLLQVHGSAILPKVDFIFLQTFELAA